MRSITPTHPARRAVLGDQLRRHAQRIGDTEAIVSAGDRGRRALTFAQLDERSCRLANALRARGIGPGDVVALMGGLSIEMLVAFWGTVRAGAAATSVNPAFTARELTHQLTHSAARAIVVDDAVAAKLDGLELAALGLRVRTSELEQLIASAPADEPDVAIADDDVALIPYTSGTTAFPKAVMLTHRNYIASTIPCFATSLGFREGDRFYYVLPLHTVSGIGSQISLLSVGATVVLPTEVTAASALRILVQERITVLAQTPTFYLQLVGEAGFDGADLSRLERAVTYGGTMPRVMFDGFARAAPGMTWITLWSQSELGQTATVGRFRSLQDIPAGDVAWIGRPTAQLEVRVVDEAGADADEGELLCRSPGVMLGYLEDPQRTAEALRDGWLHTGDLVRRRGLDLFFVDRRHDVIKSGGMNVSSVEVERVLYADDSVREVAVVGLPDDYWGQAVTAYVVARDAERFDPAAVKERAREQLAAFKLPKAIHCVDALPKDAQGKVLKRELRVRATEGGPDQRP